MEAHAYDQKYSGAVVRASLPKSPWPGISPLQAYLVNRLNLTDDNLHQFLYPSILQLPSPFLLPDIEPALNLFQKAVSEKKKIYVFADKDVDGITALSVLVTLLRDITPPGQLTADISQKDDTYGLSGAAFERIAQVQPDLLIALDCGTSNSEELARLQAAGTQSIVIDHHTIPVGQVPACLINPRRTDSEFPGSEISTVGLTCLFLLAFYLKHTRFFEKNFIIHGVQNPEDTLYAHNGRPYVLQGHPDAEAKTDLGPEIDPTTAIHVYYEKPSGQNLDNQQDSIFLKDALHDLSLARRDIWPELERVRRPLFNSGKTAKDVWQIFLFYNILLRPSLYERFRQSLDLAAIGSITDMVPLIGENRIFVKNGLLSLRTTQRAGLHQLLDSLDIRPEDLSYRNLGWDLGPHLNAPGRMGESDLCKELLLSRTTDDALATAQSIIELNLRRRERTQANLTLIESQIESGANDEATIIEYNEEFQPGVTGLVASRLSDRFQKPVVLMGPENGLIKGSVRSSVNVNVVQMLRKLEEHILEFGGHPQAAGFTIAPDKLKSFTAAWRSAFQNLDYEFEDDTAIVELSLGELNLSLYDELLFLEPFGVANPAPKFLVRRIRPQAFRFMGSDNSHAKFEANGKRGVPVDFVIWQRASELSEFVNRHHEFSVLGSIEMNTFRGRRTLQFIIEDFFT